MYPLWRKDDTGYRVVWLQPVPPQKRRPEPRRTSYTGDRVAVLTHVGIGAPAGAFGMSLDLAPVRWFAVNGGVGVSPGGTQWAVTPRLRVAASRVVFLGIGTGVSFGPYRTSFAAEGVGRWLALGGESSATLEWQRAYWHNVEASLDIYPRSGALMFHFAIGRGYITNVRDGVCTDASAAPYTFPSDEDCERTSGQSLIFASAGMGFDI